MIEANSSEEHEFVRIATKLPLHYQRLNTAERRREKARILGDQQTRMNPFLQLMERWISQEDQGGRGSDLERLLGPVLAAMNEKLDHILAILDSSDPMALRFEKPLGMSISGSGIGLTLPEYFPLDSILGLDFLLPFPFPLRIKALAKVYRVESLDLTPQQWYVATKFDVIHEEDREAIIRYIFREQRIALRMRNIPAQLTNHLINTNAEA
jgi:hypothetical protein